VSAGGKSLVSCSQAVDREGGKKTDGGESGNDAKGTGAPHAASAHRSASAVLGPPAASAAAGKAQRLQRPEKCSASEMSFCPNCNQSQKLLLSGRVLRSPDGPQEKSRATGRMQGH